jgi:hypothetical protein
MNRQEQMLCIYTANKQFIIDDFDNKFCLIDLCNYTTMTSKRDN